MSLGSCLVLNMLAIPSVPLFRLVQAVPVPFYMCIVLVGCFGCTWRVDGLNLYEWSVRCLVYLWWLLRWLPGVGLCFCDSQHPPPPPGVLAVLEVSILAVWQPISGSNLRLTFWGKTPFILILAVIQLKMLCCVQLADNLHIREFHPSTTGFNTTLTNF